MKYDYLIIGAGLYGAMYAYTATKKGYSCLVVDKREHIAGNCYTKDVDGVKVHYYGPHIFRTNSKKCWEFVNEICEFEPFINSPLACYKERIYNLPFNMNTFNEVFGNIYDPIRAKEIIELQKRNIEEPKSIEDVALSTVGTVLYEMFIKHYTEKQWGKKCAELPASIMQRVPVRYTYDNNYYNEKYQGIPTKGYTYFFEKLLSGVQIELECDYFENKNWLDKIASIIVYTGPIDKYFMYKYGKLEYRSLKFEHKTVSVDNFQGNAVVNYTDDTPYTRIVEHKFFKRNPPYMGKTVVSYEYPCDYTGENIPCYPIPTEKNLKVLRKYNEEAKRLANIIFGGRLAEYKYYNMNDIIEKFI